MWTQKRESPLYIVIDVCMITIFGLCFIATFFVIDVKYTYYYLNYSIIYFTFNKIFIVRKVITILNYNEE